jgi:hypothetical protein
LGYISSWTSFFCKSIFNGKFYLMYVLFGIKAKFHVEYEIE